MGVRWGGRFIWDSGRREAIITFCSSLQSDCRWFLVLGLLWFCLTGSFVVSYIRDYGLVLCILLGVAILHPRIRVYVMLCVSGSGALPAFLRIGVGNYLRYRWPRRATDTSYSYHQDETSSYPDSRSTGGF